MPYFILLGGDPISIHDFAKHNVYIEGVRIGSVCMALYSISCSINSFFLRNLIDRFGKKSIFSKPCLFRTSNLINTLFEVFVASTSSAN